MQTRQITNCGECAYKQDTDQGMWCPFHDESVSVQLVCDDFLGEFESPQWGSLMVDISGEAESKKDIPQFTGKDVLAYALMAFYMVISVVYFAISQC